MTATSREIAEKLCKEAIGTNSFVAEKIAAVLDAYGKEREREGYARGIKASAECAKWQAVKSHVIGYNQACMDCAIAIKALAQKDVKP